MFSGLLKKFASQKPSKDAAKKRLQFSLIYDKLEIDDTTLTNLQRDIVEVISNYFEIDTSSLELKVKRGEEVSALVFNTPILHIKRKTV
ncbi:cell division topological specificity factor MinE [Desulfobacula phenolica]|uniref:Cell division topological specificity factor n=1 Tax=Desulfobacula phenolica TaxID=90732 RepID=A0A1H2ISV4_9BACT|nr:cell division topological specificity factor MinE [Desulfobacula phenolica]SDU47142.1 cell division topological specificity factor [Desulfobacula phenolica]